MLRVYNICLLIMIRVFTNLFHKTTPLNNAFLCQNLKPTYNFASFTDKMQKKQNEKSEEEIRKQIEHLANKPTFTLMDYKQRILDELNKLKSSIRAKMSSQTQQQQKQLQLQKKVLSCLYEDELNAVFQLRKGDRKAISLVSQVDYNRVTQIFKKAERYSKMHTMLRQMKQSGEELPKDMQQLNFLYVKSGLEFQGTKQRYLKYEQRSRLQRGKYIKWRKGG